MKSSFISLIPLALIFMQVDCCHITRMSVGPYFQSGYVDCPVQPCGRYTKQINQPCCFLPAKTTTCTTVPHNNPCAAKTTTCTSIPHPPPPPCFEAFFPASKIFPCPSLAQCSSKPPFLPCGNVFCDGCW